MKDIPFEVEVPLTRDGSAYVAPTGDEPLSEVELALVRALAAILVREIREELAAECPGDRSAADR